MMECEWCKGTGTVTEPIYGLFPGGNPRDFHPDRQCCTDDELNRHAFACIAWDEGWHRGWCRQESYDVQRYTNQEAVMKVVLKHDVNRIKNGFAARSPQLKVVAHGHSPEIARRNLERLVFLYLSPFQRRGILKEELEKARLEAEGTESDLTVVTAD
jgi:hypothetical protein